MNFAAAAGNPWLAAAAAAGAVRPPGIPPPSASAAASIQLYNETMARAAQNSLRERYFYNMIILDNDLM